MKQLRSNLDVALDALEKGITPIPCHALSKVPMEPWKRFQSQPPSREDVLRWFFDPQVNVAVICTGAVVVDIDDPELVDLVLRECGDTPEKVSTPSGGVHLPYRAPEGLAITNRVKIAGKPIDIRTAGGLRLLPHSHTKDGAYEWLEGGLHRISDLPVPTLSWLTEEPRQPAMSTVIPVDQHDVMLRRAIAWAACVEGAVSGQRGHDRFYRVVCKLLHMPPFGFGLTVAQALPIIDRYNATCQPPFSEREKQHKIFDAAKSPRARH